MENSKIEENSTKHSEIQGNYADNTGFSKNCTNIYYLFKIAKAEAITRTGLQHTHARTHASSQPQTWQHDLTSQPHMGQIDGSTVCLVHPLDKEMIYYCLRAL